MTMTLGPVGSAIALAPNYDYTLSRVYVRGDERTLEGALFSRVELNSYHRIVLPVSHVESHNVSLINSWHRSGTTLRFTETDSFPGSYYTVRVTGQETSMQTYIVPYFMQFFEGVILLETL